MRADAGHEFLGDPAGEPVTALVDQPAATEAVTSLVARPPHHPVTPPSGLTPPASTPPDGVTAPPGTRPRKQKPARKKRRGRRFVLGFVLLLLLGGAGTLWVASMARVIPGLPIAGQGDREGGNQSFVWTPVIVAPCSQAELSVIRDGEDGRERCQRTSNGEEHWVREPERGFPISNPNGPFPGEECTADGDTDYSPVGERMTCADGVWAVTS